MTTRMPARGDCSAPSFDPAKPHELKRYFEDLEYLFSGASVTADTKKKRHAVRYVSVDVADIWETLPEFADVTWMYEDFKTAILALYPAADDRYKHLLGDMDLLIGTRQRLGIQSLADLAEYHSQFITVTMFLKSKGLLSDLKQKRAYVRGFSPALWTRVSQRLQLKDLDHLPDMPYEIADVQVAARFVLHGTHTMLVNAVESSPSPVIPDVAVKTEQLSDILNKFKKSIVDALNASALRPCSGASANSGPRDLKCNFCGRDHFIHNCELVNEYECAGKVKRNVDNKVVLPSGAFVPSSIPGNLLKDRVDEWHCRNPGQLAVASLSNAMLNTVGTLPAVPGNLASLQPIPQLTLSDRIASVEAELLALHAHQAGAQSNIRTHPPPQHPAELFMLPLDASSYHHCCLRHQHHQILQHLMYHWNRHNGQGAG